MGDNGAAMMKEFRAKLGISQVRAAKIFGCSGVLITYIESGRVRMGWQRSARAREALAAWEAGGMEAVAALPPFRAVRVLRSVPDTDAGEMREWRRELGLSRLAAARQLGFMSPHSIDAIERGRRRITDTVRLYMERDRRKGKVEDP